MSHPPANRPSDPSSPLRRGQLFDIPADAAAGPAEPAERFDELLSGRSFRLERIVSTGQATPPDEWYDQNDDEWVVLLTGSATLRFTDPQETIDLEAGDWLLIPAHRRHRVEQTAIDRPTVWLALHASSD